MSASLLLAWVLAQAAAPAVADGGAALAPLRVETRLDRSQVRLGEPLQYEIAITHARDQRYELSPPKDLGAFEASQVQRSRRDQPDGTALTTFQVKLAVFELGRHVIPDFPLEVTAPGQTAKVPVAGPAVEVVSSLPANADTQGADLRDIKPPVDVPIPSYRGVWILLGLVAAAIAAWFLVRWLRRPRAAPEVVEPPRPLDVRIRSALDALRREDLPAQGRAREHFFRVSEIARAYLGERYAFEALECTTPELLDALRARRTPELPYDEVVAFAHESDLVKYARSEASPADCQRALEFAYRLLERTWPPPPPPTPSTDAAHAAASDAP